MNDSIRFQMAMSMLAGVILALLIEFWIYRDPIREWLKRRKRHVWIVLWVDSISAVFDNRLAAESWAESEFEADWQRYCEWHGKREDELSWTREQWKQAHGRDVIEMVVRS